MYIKNMQAQQAAKTAAKNREALVRFHSPTMGDANAPSTSSNSSTLHVKPVRRSIHL